ncbi:low affinity iron permease family protein [Chryseolinea lacunae]|uniref:Low affinity iron permease family protein n=1 Tax=Chryseolinea lacunae TaxID=2801331 RepID=A0ABS1L0M5_9BACT|nr:low affinity iron permease family protein [Chryseolinea lacunae]MBL0745130.1 low affinity iron permease family protein [Chryseolinea lacunae]
MKTPDATPAEQESVNEFPIASIKKSSKLFDRVSKVVTRAAGRPATSVIAFSIIFIWATTGPLFHYSDTWQLVINTGTTIITFLMVFVIQQSQNRDMLALQMKLNELIACQENASNRLVDVEDLTEEELEVLKKFYIKLSTLAYKEKDLFSSHSIDDALRVHTDKRKRKSPATKKERGE